MTTKRTSKLRSVYFTSLTVENLRCFGREQTLDLTSEKGFPARWTVILGANGSGKTSLLRALGAMLIEPESPHRVDAIKNRAIFRRNDQNHTRVCATAHIGAHLDRIGRAGSQNFKLEFNYGRGERLEGERKLSIAELKVAGYAATRKLVPGDIKNEPSDDPVASLFSNAVSLRDPQSWILQLHYASLRQPRRRVARSTRAAMQLKRVEEALVRLLPDSTDIRIDSPKDRRSPAVQFKTPDGWVDIDGLSLGYQTFAAWAVDLASRLFEWYPQRADPLSQPAVCLVDEIDLHMHPAWQRAIMDDLSGIFPRTQFIATAHIRPAM